MAGEKDPGFADASSLQPWPTWRVAGGVAEREQHRLGADSSERVERQLHALLEVCRNRLCHIQRGRSAQSGEVSVAEATSQRVADALEAAEAGLRHAADLLEAEVAQASVLPAAPSVDAYQVMECSGEARLEMPKQRRHLSHHSADIMKRSAGYRYERDLVQAEQWEEAQLKSPGSYDFFKEIQLAKDGGLSEVGELWTWGRWLSAAMAVLVVASNLATLAVNDFGYIEEAWEVAKTEHNVRAYIWDMAVGVAWTFGLSRVTKGKDPRLTGAAIMSLIEMLLLTGLLCRAVRAAWVSNISSGSERRRWLHVTLFYWRLIPELSSYSGMRLLHFVSPGVLANDVARFMSYSSTRWSRSKLLISRKWLKFVVSRFFCLLIGVGCFLIKIKQAQRYMPGLVMNLGVWDILNLLMFIKQILGIVQLQLVVRWRISLLIFGGEDGIMEPHEKARMQVWEGMLARAIFEEFSRLQATALMLAFSVQDFQKLVLNETRVEKSSAGALTCGGESPEDSASSGSEDEESYQESFEDSLDDVVPCLSSKVH